MKDITQDSLELPLHMVFPGEKLTIYRDAAYLGEWFEAEVRELFAEKLLFPNDYYWREGMKEWQRLDGFIRPEGWPPANNCRLNRRPSVFFQYQRRSLFYARTFGSQQEAA